MSFDPKKLLSREFEPIRHSYGEMETKLYALGIGLGLDPTDTEQLAYVYEGEDGVSLKTLPSMVNILAYPGYWAREPDTGIDWRRLVHAEQEFVLHRPLEPSGGVIGINKVSGLWDKGAGKGALMQQQREIRDAATQALVATVTQLSFLRGNGGFGEGGSPGKPPKAHPIPERQPDAVCDLSTSPQSALIYRLSGDLNPLHADPPVAKAAGFERPILHGMATMGVALHAVLRTFLSYRSEDVKGMRVRFTAPAIPGDTLRTEMWNDEGVISLRTTAVERGSVVLNNARVDLN